MADKHVDEGKGRIKEAAGSLSGDDELKREGQADRARSSAKDNVDKAAGKAKSMIDAMRRRNK